MKKFHIALALCCASMTTSAKTITIGIDLSGSNPLLSHEHFALSASQHATVQIEKLQPGDIVNLKTFGSRADALNLLNHKFEITRRMRPQKVAQIVAQYIRSIPSQKELSQSSTNLIAWLEFTSGFACADSSHILVITDALESSAYVDGKQLLEGKKGLPKPEVDLKGCELTFFGLGAGMPPGPTKYLRSEWRGWAEQAGANFTAIIP